MPISLVATYRTRFREVFYGEQEVKRYEGTELKSDIMGSDAVWTPLQRPPLEWVPLDGLTSCPILKSTSSNARSRSTSPAGVLAGWASAWTARLSSARASGKRGRG